MLRSFLSSPASLDLDAKRLYAGWGWLLALCLLTAGCGEGGDDGSGGRNPPSTGETFELLVDEPLRPPPDLPAETPGPDARIAYYLDLLEGGDEDQLRWAWRQLERAGAAASSLLTARLDDALSRNTFLADNILASFARGVNGTEALLLLVRACDDEDLLIRSRAARALGATGSPEAVAPLLTLLNDPVEKVALAALSGLRELSLDEGLLGLLARFPDQLHPRLPVPAITVLAGHLPEAKARAFLLQTLADADRTFALAASRELVRRGFGDALPAARKRLRELLATPLEPMLLLVTTEILARTGDPDLLPQLVAQSESGDPETARNAVTGLANYAAMEARKALWKVVGTGKPRLRREALLALHQSGDPDVLSTLDGLLGSLDPDDRVDAALVLGTIRPPEAVPALVRALDAETGLKARAKMAHALALIGEPRGAEAVVRLVSAEADDPAVSSIVAYNAADALLRFPRLSDAALLGLVRAARSPSPVVRRNVCAVLARHGRTDQERAALLRLLRDPSVHVRRAAIRHWPAFSLADAGTLCRLYRTEPDTSLLKEVETAAENLLHRWER